MTKTIIALIPASLAATTADIPVTNIKIAASQPFPVVPGKEAQTNHWVIHLDPKDASETYIRLDMSPTGDASNSACLIVSETEGSSTSNFIKKVSIPVRRQVTVSSIIEIIKTAGYDKYKVTKGGQGCRYWVTSILELLAQHTVISDRDQLEAAKDALKVVWGENGPVLDDAQSDIEAGVFY